MQLASYFRLRAAGTDTETAAGQSGLPIEEARLWDEAEARGETSFNQGEKTMARDNEQVKQVVAPDFVKMKRIFLTDLKPADEKSAKARGDLSAAWKAVEDDCHVNKRAAKLLFRLNGESEEARDDFLRSLYGGMKALGIGISQDLVDKMSDQDAPEMPIVEQQGLGADSLATVN